MIIKAVTLCIPTSDPGPAPNSTNLTPLSPHHSAMSLSSLPGQEPGTGNDNVSHARTLSWLSKTESDHPDDDLVDNMDYNLRVDLHPVHNLPMTIALPPISRTTSAATAPDSQASDSQKSLDMCDNVSQLSDYSNVQKIKQDISQAASGTIGRCFLNYYNRAMTWVSILQLTSPQPLHTITAIQQLSSQAEEVLQMLFFCGLFARENWANNTHATG